MEVTNQLDMTDKAVVVTGSSRGLGRVIALRMASAGADVVVNYMSSAEAAEKVADEVRAFGVKAAVVQADVGNRADAVRLVAESIAALGKIDVLVSNAGLIIDKPFLEHTDEDWNSCVHAMLNASFYLAQAVLPHMLKRGSGRILTQNSIITEKFDFGGAKMAACAAAKAGTFAMYRSLASEIADTGITVNAVAPAIVATEMTKEFDQGVLEEACKLIPMGRFGEPDEIASAMLFLASDLAGYITGQTLRVNGGMHMA